jgi:hypothetical protein
MVRYSDLPSCLDIETSKKGIGIYSSIMPNMNDFDETGYSTRSGILHDAP